MKRIVFLICLLLITPVKVDADIFEGCNNGELEISREGGGININKRGEDPFLSYIKIDNTSMDIRNVVCLEDKYILSGYLHQGGAPTYYDSVILEIDRSGNEIRHLIKDHGNLEEVKHLYYMDNTYIVITSQNLEDDDMTFMATLVTVYDNQFNEIMVETFDEEITRIEQNGNLVSINFQWDHEYDIGVLTNGTLFYKDDYLDVLENYQTEAYIPFINEATINGKRHSNGFYIDYPGNYTLFYNNQTYQFTVHPSIDGVEDKGAYNETVQLNISNGQVFINDELYANNESINEPGYYHVDIYGNNDYHKQLTFTINADINGLINGQSYVEPISINFTGHGYLNGNLVTSPLIVDTEGDYVFRVTGENGYSEEYFFDVSFEDEFNAINFIQKIDIYIVVAVVIGGVIVIKKSK